MRSNSTPVVIATAGWLVAAGLAAQTRDPGPTPLGRPGYEWQTQQQLDKEAQEKLELLFADKTEEEWLDEALAWIVFDLSQSGQVAVDDSYRVARIDAGKKAEVTQIDDDPMSWEIGYPKKPPKDLELTLTDKDKTAIKCGFGGSALDLSRGYLGVFLHEGQLICMQRAVTGG